MHQERAPSDKRSIQPRRFDPEVVRQTGRSLADARYAVDVVAADAGVVYGVAYGLGVQLDRRDIGDDPEAVGLGGPDDHCTVRHGSDTKGKLGPYRFG